jgi:hypothetical protein
MSRINHYYAYKTHVDNKPSYALLPISEEAVYVDGMFYTDHLFLMLLSKVAKEKFHMVPKLDNMGQNEIDKRTGKERLERVRMESTYEYYISNMKDIEWFAYSFIANPEEFMEFVKQAHTDYDNKLNQIKEETTVPEAVAEG